MTFYEGLRGPGGIEKTTGGGTSGDGGLQVCGGGGGGKLGGHDKRRSPFLWVLTSPLYKPLGQSGGDFTVSKLISLLTQTYVFLELKIRFDSQKRHLKVN